jgi:seryl-tRNA(Sec) selenium transferase
MPYVQFGKVLYTPTGGLVVGDTSLVERGKKSQVSVCE